MRSTFLEWACNSRSNTVDVVIKYIIILEWKEKNLASRREIEVFPNDGMVMGLN